MISSLISPQHKPLRAGRLRVTRRQAALALGALLAFDLLFYVFAVRPLDLRDQRKQALIANMAAQVRELSAQVEESREVVEKIEAAREQGDKLLEEIMLRRRTTFSNLLAELDRAAEQARLEARERNYNVQPVEGAEDYDMVTITANFRGEYENLVRFLNLMDRSGKFLIVGSLGAAPQSDSTALQVTMAIDTFVRDL